jgi:hypothetical protein
MARVSWSIGCHTLLFALVSARAARAEEPPADRVDRVERFGARGHLVLPDLLGVSSGVSLGASYPGGAVGFSPTGVLGFYTLPSLPGGPGISSIWFAPSADYFVAEGLSVGGVATVAVLHVSPPGQEAVTSRAYALRPRVGYAFALAEDVAWWPRATAGVAFVEPGGPTTYTLGADLGFVFRMGRHALLDVGPTLAYVRSSIDDQGAGGTIVSGGVHGSLGLAF